jgi:excisionase family DNA binding protein
MVVHCPARTAKFAEYSFDFLHLELRKDTSRIRLEIKPAQVLALLLARPGELVSRQELQRTLWPDRVHLDFEHGLNKSIHKLRTVLSDKSATPDYIETVSRRGYRFIAPVEFAPCPVRSQVDSAGQFPVMPHASITPRLLLVEEAAVYLSTTTSQIELLLKDGAIPSFVLGERTVIDRVELDRYVERRTVQAKAAMSAPDRPNR